MRPMEEWLNSPQNKELMQRIRRQVWEEAQQKPVPEEYRIQFTNGEYERDPMKIEQEINFRQSSLREMLMAEAPDEYLDETQLEMRRERQALSPEEMEEASNSRMNEPRNKTTTDRSAKTRSEKGEGSLMTRLLIAGLALVCFFVGWLFGSSTANPGARSASRWIMTGPENMFLLNTRTGEIWKFYFNSDGDGPNMGFNYVSKPPPDD